MSITRIDAEWLQAFDKGLLSLFWRTVATQASRQGMS